MASPQSSSLIQDYSQAFITLQAGKREMIQWGAEPVILNRYVVDAAGSTSECDPQSVLQGIDPSKVPQGESERECLDHCKQALKRLVSLQEEVVVLQKTARESGISAGLLTIIGQAATQSPGDNGASVLKQLSELVTDDDPETNLPSNSTAETVVSDRVADRPLIDGEASDIVLEEVAANDIDRLDFQRLTGLQKITSVMREQWQSILVDASACMVAACIAISLIN